MAYEYKIGTTSGGLTLLSALSTKVAWPKGEYLPHSNYVELADGSRRGMGYPIVRWKWGFIPLAMRTMLRTFCTGASAEIYIRTRVNDADGWASYKVKVLWPEEEIKDAGRRIDFVLEFRVLEAVA